MPLRLRLGDSGRLALAAIVFAAIVLALAVAAAFYFPNSKEIPWKWVRFSLEVIFLIWISLTAYWRIRKKMAFWGIFAGFLLVHVFGVGYFYYAGQGLGVLEVGLVGGAEWVCMAVIIYKFLHTTPDLDQRHSRTKSRWTPTL